MAEALSPSSSLRVASLPPLIISLTLLTVCQAGSLMHWLVPAKLVAIPLTGKFA